MTGTFIDVVSNLLIFEKNLCLLMGFLFPII